MNNILKKGNPKIKIILLDILLAELLILSDQITKYFAVIKLKHQPSYNVIDGIIEFNYLENKGAAFGLLPNQKELFLFVGIVVLAVIIYVLYKTPVGRKYTILNILLTMIASGAVGNMIDRFRFGYVIDFIYVSFINFPIFNMADVYVTTASIIFIFLLLFYYKEKDLNFLSFRMNKYREIK